MGWQCKCGRYNGGFFLKPCTLCGRNKNDPIKVEEPTTPQPPLPDMRQLIEALTQRIDHLKNALDTLANEQQEILNCVQYIERPNKEEISEEQVRQALELLQKQKVKKK